MGTVFSIDLRTPAVEEHDVDEVIRWLHWVDRTFSTYRPDSWISRLGRGEVNEGDCPQQVRQVLARGRALNTETSGYFSVVAGGHLDPSGLVKGWATELASDLLVASGSTSHCLNGGGDVQCVGSAAVGRPWRVGITDPHRPGRIVATVCGTDFAVATSGEAERGRHIQDPHGGAGPSGLASLSVVGRHLGDVDPYATAAFAMGDAARSWLEQTEGVEAFAVTSDGGTWFTGGLADVSGALTLELADRRRGHGVDGSGPA